MSDTFDVNSPGDKSIGVASTSTNNLEKAYEDLEKEINEIKMKLQQSVGTSGGAVTGTHTHTDGTYTL